MGETKERNGFTFYRTFSEGAMALPQEEQLEFLWAIFRLALDNQEPNEEDFSALGRTLWRMIKPNLLADRRKFENGCKGGAPSEKMKGNQNARKYPKDSHETNLKQSKNKPKTNLKQSNVNVNVDVDVNDNVNDNVDVDVIKRDNKSAKMRFTPPTFAELKEFIDSGFYQVDANSFYSHYEAIGWKVGKNSMKDWKAAVRSWHSREMKERKDNTQRTDDESRYEAVMRAVAEGYVRAHTPQNY